MSTRQRWLLIIVAVLLVGNVIHWVYSGWGMITIHADNQPLAEVVRKIQKQGHATIRTDIPADTMVTMHVDKVPLTEALETLSIVTDSRWRLTYLIAGDKGTIANALGALASGNRPEGWKSIYYPVPDLMEDEDRPPDPRKDTWAVKEPAEKTVQSYLEEAGRSVSASFLVPEKWNPTVNSKLRTGEVRKLMPKLASAAKGQVQEVFLLQRGGGRGRETADDGDQERRWAEGRRRGEGMEQRMQAEIDKLPAEKRAAAQAELDERKAFFASLRELPEDRRRERMQEFFERQDVQEKMEERDAQRDAKRTPEQRQKRYRSYVERKEQIRNGN